MKRIWFLLVLLPLGGCVTTQGGSVVGGECKFIQRPQYVVKGARQYDQDWIDSTIEGGVGACGWTRPAPRPAQFDAVPSPKAKPVTSKKRPKKGTIWQMLRTLHHPKPAPPIAPVPVTPIADPPPPPEPVAAPALSPAPPACSAIDKLLSPGACP